MLYKRNQLTSKSFIMKDYNNPHSGIELYKWPHPKRVFPNHINFEDHDVLGQGKMRLRSKSAMEIISPPKTPKIEKEQISNILKYYPEEPTDNFRKPPYYGLQSHTPISSQKRLMDFNDGINKTNNENKDKITKNLNKEYFDDNLSEKSDCSRYNYVCSSCINKKLINENIEKSKNLRKIDLEDGKKSNELIKNELKKDIKSSNERQFSLYKELREALKQSIEAKKIKDAEQNKKVDENISIVNDQFGLEHGKIREFQKEKIREMMRDVIMTKIYENSNKSTMKNSDLYFFFPHFYNL